MAAAGLIGAAEAMPVAACASAAGRCKSACADESVPEVEAAVGVVVRDGAAGLAAGAAGLVAAAGCAGCFAGVAAVVGAGAWWL